ncbi:MAG: hypothetical protein KJP00_06810, partial [Bacteroidia bacterium]|nr:hypothetical protein [Bacteroidia bacterium]
MIHLSAAQIQECISPSEVILAVRAGLISESKGDYFIPQRMHIDQDSDTHLLMPAFGKKYNCTKLVSVIPDNKQRGLPIISGTVILNDATTGTPLALMDAPMITALRTAAIGAIGMDMIAPKEIDAIGVIGCGVQGIWQSIYASAVRNFKNIYCYSRS